MRLLPVEYEEKIPRIVVQNLTAERLAGDVAADGPASPDAARDVVYSISDEEAV